MTGKNKCKMLRDIRRSIAAENEIPFHTEDCRYKGDCKGTCPKCEEEVRYLERQLEKKRSLGMRVTVSAVAVGLIASAAGCTIAGKPTTLEGDVPYTETDIAGAIAPDDTDPVTACPPETLEGEIAEPFSGEEVQTLEGDVAYTEAPQEDTATLPAFEGVDAPLADE